MAFLFTRACLQAWEGDTDDATWIHLKGELEERGSTLSKLMTQAQGAGLTTDYAFVSQVVIDRFLKFAQYDRDNPGLIQKAYEALWWTRKIPDQNYATNLPFDELQSCIEVADHAISELQQQLRESIVLSTPVDFRNGSMTIGKGSFLRDGEPVFPSKFTWMPDDDDLMEAFGRMGGVYYALTDLNQDGTIKRNSLNSDIAEVKNLDARNIAFQQFFIGHRAPSWMIDQNPEIQDGGRNFVTYDTDSPVIRRNFDRLFKSYLPDVTTAAGKQPRMHLLANEPNFATRKGGWQADKGISLNTMARYRNWLIAKYSTIENLNQTYGTSYADFEQARDALEMPVDPKLPGTLQGGPVWYDWCRFNMDRINDWFSFLKKGVRSNDPLSSPVTIKVLGRQLSTEWRDDGMDMEYLAGLMDVLGADTHTIPGSMTNANLKGEQDWLDRYVLEWVSQSMMLDFYKSLYPEKPYYDSEWHGFSTQKWIDFSMDRNYIRSALWLGFTHGMNAIQSWVWSRKESGSFLDVNSNFIGEVLTQPTALDAYGRAMKELNAHASTVTQLVKQERQFYIFYCEESAIQDLSYIPKLEDVYEALKLLNLRVGFTTPSRVSGLSTKTNTVIVPPTQYITDTSQNALQAFANAGGHVVLVDAPGSFLKTELGITRSEESGFVPFASVTYGKVELMADALDVVLDSVKPVYPIKVTIQDTEENPAYGVLTIQSFDKLENKAIIALINTSKFEREVSLQVPLAGLSNFVNLITQEKVDARQVMAPFDVLLLRTDINPSSR